MLSEFNAEEILEIACQIERNGAAFYTKAAKIVSSRKAKDLLLVLASMEEDHESAFDEFRADKTVLQQLLGDPDNDAVKYLQAIAGGHVFPLEVDPSTEVDAGMSAADIFKLAITKELASIAFYNGLKELLTNEAHKGKLDNVVREEMRHVTILTEHLIEMKE